MRTKSLGLLRHLAEREGFYCRRFLQVAVKPTVSDNSLCLCGCQADSNFRCCFYSFPYCP